jgi:hypothetical protein
MIRQRFADDPDKKLKHMGLVVVDEGAREAG